MRSPVGTRRPPGKHILLDRSLEALPLFRLSDSAEEASILFTPPNGGRWRVLPAPGDRLPGTFDQDVYVELCRRYLDAGSPEDGVITFTLHAFLRSIGRRADGRTYEQLRAALNRLERTG
ncbi:MAG: replication initiator protein A, partial [Gemmatimonadetes bacterium]|nr:replication initiator protein A [Gemmatimonadota bacterium]